MSTLPVLWYNHYRLNSKICFMNVLGDVCMYYIICHTLFSVVSLNGKIIIWFYNQSSDFDLLTLLGGLFHSRAKQFT